MNKRNALSQHTNHVRDVAEKENCQLPWANSWSDSLFKLRRVRNEQPVCPIGLLFFYVCRLFKEFKSPNACSSQMITTISTIKIVSSGIIMILKRYSQR